MAQIQCFCVRRANPFQGVAAVVKTSQARAFSVDGRNWQIQVLARPPRSLWANTDYQDTQKYFRFGVWSEREGLVRVPLNPVLNLGDMIGAAQQLLALLPETLAGLPFPQASELELWLLDREQRPLALLDTALEGSDLNEMEVPDWYAGGRGERSFVSPALQHQGVPERDASGHHHPETLERLVQNAAGSRRNRQWFRFDGSGEAFGLAEQAPEELAGRRLPARLFPELPLRTDWPRQEDRSLVADYVAWLSPYLLTLQNISEGTRQQLERQAVRYALLVERTWRLYPKFLNQDLLKQARVEARIRLANAG